MYHLCSQQQSELEELLGEEGELKQKYTRGLDADEALIARAEAVSHRGSVCSFISHSFLSHSLTLRGTDALSG